MFFRILHALNVACATVFGIVAFKLYDAHDYRGMGLALFFMLVHTSGPAIHLLALHIEAKQKRLGHLFEKGDL